MNCQDCFRCVRSCPVKAIGIKKGHARVIEERCILCGRCVIECPQQAKEVESQLEKLTAAIKEGKQIIMSLAPSYIAAFPTFTLAELAKRLNQKGITVVAETAVGAELVSQAYAHYLDRNTATGTVISSCCPVIVNTIEKYYPELINNLAPVLSPMIVHANLLKAQYGQEAFVVFAGPCIAKIAEGSSSPGSQVDAAITFEQLKHWLEQPDTGFLANDMLDTQYLASESYAARCFPIAGGIVLPFAAQYANKEVVAVDGIENCIEVFEGLISHQFAPNFIEAFACPGGCINGPAIGVSQLMQTKRNKVLSYAQQAEASTNSITIDKGSNMNLFRSYEAKPVKSVMPSEDEVVEILKQTGKFTRKDEKNCGACGYNTCREKAIAVFQGLAEIDMCVPYMRSKAESFANIIVENSLNAIIAVNEKMIIKEFNPAVIRMFGAAREIYKGMRLTELFDCTDFIAAAKFGHKIVGKRVEYAQYGLITEQMIIPVPEHGLVIAIITDVTALERKNQELQQMKLETVEKATEIINKQMHVAQEIAGLLGETTAETKSALLELIMLIKGKGEA